MRQWQSPRSNPQQSDPEARLLTILRCLPHGPSQPITPFAATSLLTSAGEKVEVEAHEVQSGSFPASSPGWIKATS